MKDVEGFVTWLRAHGTSEQQVEAYKHFIGVIASHPSLSAAIRAEQEAGADERRIKNIRQVALRMSEYEAERAARAPDPALELARDELPPRELRAPAPTASPRMDMTPPRRGCVCRSRADVYLDDDFGALAKMLGGGAGIGTFLLVRMIGLLGALTIALSLASAGGTATVLSIRFRCESCRRTVTDLDDDERARVRKGRAKVTLITLALMAAAAICAVIWWQAVEARAHNRL